MNTAQNSESLQAALAERNVLLRELDHRVKNNLQRVISLLDISAQQVKGADVHPVFVACRNRLYALALIHETLYKSANLQQVDVVMYLEQLVVSLCRHYDSTHCHMQPEIKLIPLVLDTDRLLDLGLVLSELVSNVYQHAFPHQATGTIHVEMKAQTGNQVVLVVADNGVGMRAADAQKANTCGLTFVRGIIERTFMGDVQIQHEGGTRVIMSFPACIVQCSQQKGRENEK